MIRLLCLILKALCQVRTVNYSALASGFATNCDPLSSVRRIQRFMKQVDLPMELVARLIFSLLPKQDSLVLSLDRTNWKLGKADINILMLGVCYRNVAFPLMFRLLDKKGNSNTRERIDLMQQFIDLFGAEKIEALVADREFVGKDWLAFLNQNQIQYHIRIRNNFKVYLPRKSTYVKASHLFNALAVGQLDHYPHIVELHGEYCYLSGIKTTRQGKLELLLIVSFNQPQAALETYKQRWQIETLFRGLKTSGFNLEKTHVTHLNRLQNLILVVMIAFVWCYRIGDHIDTKIKNIPLKKHGRRAVSIFKYGLDYTTNCLLTGNNRYNIDLVSFLSCT